MPDKPKFNPNIPYKEADDNVQAEKKPIFDPSKNFEPISPKLREGDTNVVLPTYKTPKDLEIDKALDFIQQNSRRNMRDDEKQILRSMMKNPSTPKGELSDAIVTLQGKKAKQIDNSWTTPDYYMKRDEKSGNYKPIALEQGEKIPVGYHAASIWGTKESAKDDNAWQDIGKSLANGVFGLMGGVVDVAQSGYELVTGDESETLRSGKNAIEGLKFEKDADLDRPVYNMEGITKWADLLDKDRFDFSPQALWGTFNSTAESLTEFGLGSLTGATWLKGAKALKYGYKGIDKALDLGKAGKLGAIFTGSFFTNIGETRDAAEEAGLEGRDKGAVSLGIATVKSAIDAAFGLEGKIMSNAFKASEREVFKNLIKKAEKDAVTGLITPNGFKQLMKEASLEYSTLAKVGSKSGQVVKDMIEEGSNEVATDFAQKAGEQLWDKLTPDERGQFGTDAFDAKSFGSYVNSFTQGAISGGMMSIPSQVLKNNHDNQSINAYERVKEGTEAVNALKTDLNNALDKGEITQSEHEQAMFKIDAYDKYNQETKGANLKPEDEKKAFELSFQIQGLKTEIPTNENEISKLDPIPRSKVEGKQSQVKKLQKELTEIIERGQVKGEPVVAKQTEEKIIKDKEKEIKAEDSLKGDETNSDLNQKEPKVKQPKIKAVKVDLEEGEGTTEIKEGNEYVKEPKLPEQPALKDETRTYDTIDNETFNHTKFPSRTKFQMIVDKLSKWQNKEMLGVIKKKSYKHYDKKTKSWIPNSTLEVELEDGKRIRFASSMYYDNNNEEGFRSHTRNERLLGNEEGVPVGLKLIDINNPKGLLAEGEYTPGKKVLKIYNKRTGQFLSWAKETHKGKADSKKADGSLVTTAEEGDILKTLEGQDYNESTKGNEGDIARIITPKPKPTPTEKAKEATDEIWNNSGTKFTGKSFVAKDGNTYTIEESELKSGDKVIKVKDKEGKTVSSAYFTKNEDGTYSIKKGTRVESEIQGIGLASAIYNYFDNNIGKIKRTDTTTDEGDNLWNSNKNRINAKYDAELKALENGKQESAVNGEKTIRGTTEETNTNEENKRLAEKDKWEEGTDIVINESKNGFYTEDELEKHEKAVQLKLDDYFDEAEKKYGSFEKANEEINKSRKAIFENETKPTDTHKEYWNLIEERDRLQIHNEKLLYDIVNNSLSENKNISDDLKKSLIEYYFKMRQNHSAVHAFGSANLNGDNSISKLLSNESLPKLAKEIAKQRAEEMNLNFDALYSTISGWGKEKQQNFLEENAKIAKEIQLDILNKISNSYSNESFQKVSQRKGDFTKVRDKIAASFPKINVEVNADKFNESQSTVAGKVSADGKNIYLNPNYAGLDSPIHEGGHILIDAMGYNNKIIQAAIKQLRNTPLYAETKERYKELSESELDKEVLAEAIGREGADIFDKVEDRSKFKAYLDYIFDWLKQKLGLDKNVAKSLAKQIIGGIKTKNLEGTNTGKEQFQKTDKEKKKPFAAQALKYNQYAIEEGFDAQKEFDKYEEASVIFKEAKLDEKLAEDAADEAVTEEEIKAADAELEEKRVLLKEASKEFAIKAKKYLGYKKYQKDFRAVQAILEDKDLDEYTEKELNDLITKLFAFNDRAAKAVKERAYQKLGHMAGSKQHEIHKGKEGVIESLTKTSDIGPLAAKILHISHFPEKNPDMQALGLASGKAIIEKLSEANSLKNTHEKLGLKVIQEENKRLGIKGIAMSRFSSDSSKYFDWMINEEGEYLTIDEAKNKGLSEAKINYLKFHRETVDSYRNEMSANDFENAKMAAIRVDKNFKEAYKSEGLIPAFSYYLGGGATNLGRVRILHNGKVMSYSEIEKNIIANVDKNSIKSMAKALFDLLVANIKARYQLKKGENIDELDNPLELKGDAEYSLNEEGKLVSKFDKPRAKDRGYSKDFYKAMIQFIDESAHVKHISKIMPLVESVEYLNKKGYAEEGYVIKPNVSKWIEDWKALHIFKEPYVNDPIIDATVKLMRKLVASTTMWFNIPANTINVFMGNYNNWRAENAETLARGNARLFGGKGSRKEVGIVNDYALAIIKKYNLVNQDFDSHPVIKANNVFSKLATWGTQVGEYQIQGSLGLGLLSQEEFDSFEFAKDKYGNNVLTVKKGVDEDKLKSKMTQVKNRVTDIQGKYPDEDRRNIMRGEFGKALFQFKVWMPDWFKERFGARYINAYGQEKEGSYIKMLRVGVKEMKNDLKKGDIKKALTNPAFVQNLKGMATIGALLALKHSGDDDDDKKKGGLNWDSALSQVLFIFDLEQDKYMVSNPAAILGKLKDFINAFESLIGFEEDAWEKTKRVLPGNKAITFVENQMK